MSSWPLISDFARMLQNPQVAFRAPELKTCSVEMNQLGQPKPRSGNFATVYRGYRPDGSEFAIRIFNRRQDERIEHYRTISEYLEQRTLSSIVKFEYDERGLRSAGDGKLYPLLTMEWVPGITLLEWIRDRCREGYAEALKIGAEVWLHVVRELAHHSIMHGDLQHGNVMVSPEGHFKLVDYDCMCVPSLVGKRNLEIGMVPYQHPARNMDTTMFLGLDNFSALVIYVALRALAAAPQLWTTYVDQPGYDKILFRQSDFDKPDASPLYHDLLRSPDEQVRDLAHYLFELVKYKLHDLPPVDEVLLWCQSVESLISAHEWDKVVQLVDRLGPGEQIASELQPYVQEARKRVTCRHAAEEAWTEGNEERLEQLYATGLLQDYPAAAHLLEPARQSAEVRPVLRVLASARQLQAWDKLKSTWLTYQQLLTGRASARVYEQEVQKLLTVDRMRELLAASQVDDRALQEAWDYVERLGGHPTAELFRPAVQQRLARRQSLLKLQELLLQSPQVATLAFDRQVLAAVPPDVAQGLDPASPMYKQYQAVNKRIQIIKRVREVEKTGTIESETFIANVMRHLPNSYHEGLARRSQQARQRIYVYREFVNALQEPCLEAIVLQAWRKLGHVRGQGLASAELHTRVELAKKRLPLIQALMAIPEDAPEAEKQHRVLETWDDAVLGNCHEAEPWRPFYQRFQTAAEAVKQIEQALESGQLQEAERLLGAPELQGIDLPPKLAQAVQAARTQIQQVALAKRQALINVLRENRRADFAELFDAATLADICRQSRHHQPLVGQWLEAEILPLNRIGLAADPATAIQRDEQSNVSIVWTWPPPRISNVCRLVFCKQRPRAQVPPDDVSAEYSVTVSREQWNPAVGLQVVLQPEWEGSYVIVWAVVDLGYQIFFSEPLEVGQLQPLVKQPPQPQRKWGLFRGWRGEKKTQATEGELPPEASPEPAVDVGQQSGAQRQESGKAAEEPPTTNAEKKAEKKATEAEKKK
ncbi:MAG: AarF/UbiB family protein [Planctomycetota bacterium]|nr:AarF/UbiB family protein [Planctomycetota bacterium]